MPACPLARSFVSLVVTLSLIVNRYACFSLLFSLALVATLAPLAAATPTTPVAPTPAVPAPAGPTTPVRPPDVTPTTRPETGTDEETLMSQSIASPAPPTGGWQRLQVSVPQTDAPPAIDGRLNDACWKTAFRAQGFYRLGTTAPITEQTEAWVTASKTHLYVAFHCLDSHPEQIRASETQRGGGGVFNDDAVSIDIDSQNSRRNFSTFVVTAGGIQAEEIEGGTADNVTWAGDWKAATRRTKTGWTAEIAIPFTLLKYPRGAKSFGVLLRRKLARETFQQIWPYVPPQGERDPDEFLSEFSGLTLPNYAPRPTFLPYVLATGGATSSARQGIDVKYPLTDHAYGRCHAVSRTFAPSSRT
jgi:hypothetical protein